MLAASMCAVRSGHGVVTCRRRNWSLVSGRPSSVPRSAERGAEEAKATRPGSDSTVFTIRRSCFPLTIDDDDDNDDATTEEEEETTIGDANERRGAGSGYRPIPSSPLAKHNIHGRLPICTVHEDVLNLQRRGGDGSRRRGEPT